MPSSLKTAPSLDKIRHSLAHLLAAAVLKKFTDAKLGIGPTIEDGFYYDFSFASGESADGRGPDADSRGTISDTDLKDIEKEMRKMIVARLPFTGKRITPADARKLFRDQPFKLELIQELVKEKKPLTIYRTGNYFVDLCKGGHVKNTKEINPDAFELTRIAGAYWRGDEKRPQLQRVYGIAFLTKKELATHKARLLEAERRDHKRLGPALDLFTFSELVGPGLPLWTPKGTRIRDLLDNFVWELREKAGYLRTDIPHLTKKDLYERSGHWEKFKDELFRIKTREGHEFVVKPMNCPHHTQVYARKQWSYRELPQRYASTTKVYRDEQTGELAGLTRVRAITQDDAHVFCRPSQTEKEIDAIWNIVEAFYGAFGLPLSVRLSLHDPQQMKKYLGAPALWKKAEAEIKKIAAAHGAKPEIAAGEAAFYGPKIDFMAKDSLGREWQVATIQLDLNMPERFDLACIDEKGKKERIVMIHAAIMGSIERLLAILIEHFAGAFPVWLAPVQARVIPISEKFQQYARSVLADLAAAGIRAELADSNETLGKRIRAAEMEKIPYVLVVGEQEQKNKTVNVRPRRGGAGAELALAAFTEKLKREIRDKK